MCPLDSLDVLASLWEGPKGPRMYLGGAAALQGSLPVEADLQEGGAKTPLVSCCAEAVGPTRQALRGQPGDPLYPFWGPGPEVMEGERSGGSWSPCPALSRSSPSLERAPRPTPGSLSLMNGLVPSANPGRASRMFRPHTLPCARLLSSWGRKKREHDHWGPTDPVPTPSHRDRPCGRDNHIVIVTGHHWVPSGSFSFS